MIPRSQARQRAALAASGPAHSRWDAFASKAVPLALLLALHLLAMPGMAVGQGALERALADPRVQAGLEGLGSRTAAGARLLAEIGGIVSPSGQEHERAEQVAREMRRMGLSQVRVDGSPNAVGVVPGRSGKALVFVSTLDDLATVAEHQRRAPGPPRVEGDRVVGPGTNTSSITVAMLMAADAYLASGLQPEHDLVFAAVAQEETGLVGMHALLDEYRDRALGFVDILGDGRSISYGAISIHWWRVEGEGPPGHSLGGGLPNVNLGLARAVDRILSWAPEVQDPGQRTVVNVAVLRSGEVFNHKPASGWFSLDLRSLDRAMVNRMEEEVRGILQRVSEETGITLQMEPVQLTPGGQIPGFRDSELVRTAEGVSRFLGLEPQLGIAGSSNMNVPLGEGVPAIGLGGSRGGDRGNPDEWADVPAMVRAAKHVFLLASALGG
jgi:acetylornithine deacetylase/succinyl-diaminopimelate desuccinylase-like protein